MRLFKMDQNEIDLLKGKNLMALDSMSKFEYDWNGNGGKKFSDNSISLFKQVINELIKQPEIAPTGRDSLYIEYTLNDGSLLVFELSPDELDEVYIPQGDYSRAESAVYTSDYSRNINDSVNNFSEKTSE